MEIGVPKETIEGERIALAPDAVRPPWQIASLGGRPLELDFIPDAEGEGGYARPLTEEENAQVRDALADNARKQDIIVTTAAIEGL
jgi:NAD/NADP transhydrogenase alpha subunit